MGCSVLGHHAQFPTQWRLAGSSVKKSAPSRLGGPPWPTGPPPGPLWTGPTSIPGPVEPHRAAPCAAVRVLKRHCDHAISLKVRRPAPKRQPPWRAWAARVESGPHECFRPPEAGDELSHLGAHWLLPGAREGGVRRRSAVTCTIDDSQPSHVDHWPELKAEGGRMTFYLNPVNNRYAGYDATWRDALAWPGARQPHGEPLSRGSLGLQHEPRGPRRGDRPVHELQQDDARANRCLDVRVRSAHGQSRLSRSTVRRGNPQPAISTEIVR